jgi:hypothetical protein
MKMYFKSIDFSTSIQIGIVATIISTGLGYAATSVSSYGVFSRNNYNQNNASTLNTSDFSFFYAEVIGTNIDELTTANFSGPVLTDENLFTTGSRATRTKLYTDVASRDADYPAGEYTVTLDTESSILEITAGVLDVFPNAPMIAGGSWDGGRLQVSETGYTFNFNTPNDTDYVRLYLYQQGGTNQQYYYEGDGTTSSFTVSGADLELGVNYGAALDFVNLTDTQTAYGGAIGRAGYMNRNEFQISVVSIPEPSTTSILITGLALIVLDRRRK